MDDTSDRLSILAELAVHSSALRRYGTYSLAQWRTFFSYLPEKTLEDFELILKEEQAMLMDVEKKRRRRHEVAKTRFLHHVERLLNSSHA